MSVILPDRRRFVTASGASLAAGALAGRAFGRAAFARTPVECPIDVYQVVNVKDYGATGDGSTNDQPAIQALINSLATCPGVGCLYFPRGVYLINDSLTFPQALHRSGIYILGSGAGFDGAAGFGSTIKWGPTAPVNCPMVVMDGTGSFRISDLTLDGSELAYIGLNIRDSASLGSGYGIIENLYVENCLVGVDCGYPDDGNNCGDCTWLRCFFNGCAIGFRNYHKQAVNHSLIDCTFWGYGVTSAIAIQTAASPVYCRNIECNSIDKFMIATYGGSNFGESIIDGVRLDDAYSSPRTILFDAVDDGLLFRASFRNAWSQVGQSDTSRSRFYVRPGKIIRVHGGSNLHGAENSTASNRGPLLTQTGGIFLCEACELDPSLIDAFGNTVPAVFGTCTGGKYHFRDCINQWTAAAFIKDLQN